MSQIYFLFTVHNHQPVGNFEHVFADAWRRCYRPFLDLLKRHPGVRCALHYSGPLFEWLELNQPEAFIKIKELVDRRQVEMLGGGFYEPILPAIPRVDALGQLALMSDYLRAAFGCAPRGLWLAERVWEPGLASLIREAALSYTLLDDSHFVYAGLDREDISGYYVTEDEGRSMGVFPINKQLRYLVPFSEPRGAIDYLRQVSERHPEAGITLGDDGEKFGLWPGTYKWVYEERYLESFFTLLEENSDWLKMLTPSEYLDRFPPKGKVYLPAASYDEMMEWALPARVQASFERVIEDLKRENRYDRLSRFLRGGFWRNFLVKYPESNLQRSKSFHVSRMVHRAIPDDLEAKKSLWRSQCNCAYWHGLFGGVYLNYLRHANYSNMLKAEVAADRSAHGEGEWVAYERVDYDQDGGEDILLSSARVNAYLSPGIGGSLFQLDYKPRYFNLANGMTRREEAYHAAMLKQSGANAPAGGAARSIHEMAKIGSPGLAKALHYDWYPRRSLLDHFFGPDATLDGFSSCEYPEQGGFVNQPYEVVAIEQRGRSLVASLWRRGTFNSPAGRRCLEISKVYTLRESGVVNVDYCVSSKADDPLELWMGVEFNMTLLAGNEAERCLSFPGSKHRARSAGSRGEIEGIDSVELVDGPDGFATRISWGKRASLWHFPIETVSQSEKGFDLNYQGTLLLPHFKFALQPQGSKKLSFEISFREL
jgi:alpha-amylase